jgi:hypothetical protein
MTSGVRKPDCLVFSRNRACQLDGFLRSLDETNPGLYETVTVLYRDEIGGYDVCALEHPDVAFVPEEFFGPQFLDWFDAAGARVVFHTDDDVFYRTAPVPNPYELAVSLRLGRNTTYCHPLGVVQQPPDFSSNGAGWLTWKWREAELDFAYPCSLNGTVFAKTVLERLLDFPVQNPTQLEAELAARAGDLATVFMSCPEHSCVVSIPANRVTEWSHNPIGGSQYETVDALQRLYAKGWRLALDRMDFGNVSAAHQEIELRLRRSFTPSLQALTNG